MEFLIISGLSGGGKSRAADVLEDMDYYCVDNLPSALLPKFAELCLATRGRFERVALVMDVRSGDSFDELSAALDGLWQMGCEYRILFVESDVATIVRRYKESRRPHPLAGEGEGLEDAVRREIDFLTPLRDRADYIINTANLNWAALQKTLGELFPRDGEGQRRMDIHVTSFGFKYGIPMEADLVFDVRFLPNPFYVENLKPLCGLDRDVAAFLFSFDATRTFLKKLEDMIEFLLPLYQEEGKYTLTIAIGCTGGRHRSVAVADALTDWLRRTGNRVSPSHRDMEKG